MKTDGKGSERLDNLRKIKRVYEILALVCVGIGLLFMIKPDIAIVTLCRVCGIFFLGYGVVRLFGYFSKDLFQLAFQFDLAIGLFLMVIGAVLIWRVDQIMIIFPVVVGICILIDGVCKLQTALDARKFGIERWWIILLIAILVALVGACLAVLPVGTTRFVVRLLGFNLCLDGCLNFWVVLKTVNILKRR